MIGFANVRVSRDQEKAFRHLAGIYSARLGQHWRVLYEIDDAKLVMIVLDPHHRPAVYRRW